MDSAPQQQWLKAIAGRREIVLQTGDLESQAAAARAGLGIAALPHFVGDNDPGLIRYDERQGGVGRDIWLVVHRDLRHSPLIRAVMDFLVRCAGPN